MSKCRNQFAVFNLPVFEFLVTPEVQVMQDVGITLVGYIDIFGNYFDMSMFSYEIIHRIRRKYDRYKMSQMQEPSGSGQDTERMSNMYQ